MPKDPRETIRKLEALAADIRAPQGERDAAKAKAQELRARHDVKGKIEEPATQNRNGTYFDESEAFKKWVEDWFTAPMPPHWEAIFKSAKRRSDPFHQEHNPYDRGRKAGTYFQDYDQVDAARFFNENFATQADKFKAEEQHRQHVRESARDFWQQNEEDRAHQQWEKRRFQALQLIKYIGLESKDAYETGLKPSSGHPDTIEARFRAVRTMATNLNYAIGQLERDLDMKLNFRAR